MSLSISPRAELLKRGNVDVAIIEPARWLMLGGCYEEEKYHYLGII
jgi:hypothetical protein